MTVRSSVMACRACELCKIATKPIPFKGSSDARVVVLGEAPGKVEDTVGEVFVGPSGQLAHTLLQECGFGTMDVAWLNAVSCFPNRTPTAREVTICSGNVDRQLTHIRPDYILAFGGVAVGRWFADIRMGDIRGQFFKIAHPISAWVVATWHPAAILRNPRLEKEAVSDIRRLRRVVQLQGRDPLAADRGAMPYPFNRRCVLCHEFGDRWLSADGSESSTGEGAIAFCEKHWQRRQGVAGGGRTTGKGVKSKTRQPTNQEGMF